MEPSVLHTDRPHSALQSKKQAFCLQSFVEPSVGFEPLSPLGLTGENPDARFLTQKMEPFVLYTDRPHSALQSKKQAFLLAPQSGAICRIRTDDLPLTRRLLWPTELRWQPKKMVLEVGLEPTKAEAERFTVSCHCH